jgi:hypothetical protein
LRIYICTVLIVRSVNSMLVSSKKKHEIIASNAYIYPEKKTKDSGFLVVYLCALMVSLVQHRSGHHAVPLSIEKITQWSHLCVDVLLCTWNGEKNFAHACLLACHRQKSVTTHCRLSVSSNVSMYRAGLKAHGGDCYRDRCVKSANWSSIPRSQPTTV